MEIKKNNISTWTTKGAYTDNPYYSNYLFSQKDLKRRKIKYIDLWERIRVWLAPMLCQVNGGYTWHCKIVNGKYFVFKYEVLPRGYTDI